MGVIVRARHTKRRAIRKARRRERRQTRRNRIQNLSLRMSFMLYVLLYSLLAAFLIVCSSSYFSNQQSTLYWAYEADEATRSIVRLTFPADDVLRFNAQGEITIADAVLSGAGTARLSPQRVLQSMPENVLARYELYGTLSILSVPFWILLCLIGASSHFYRRKLREPLALLQDASAQIAQDNLDFHIAYANRDEMGQLCASFEKMRAALHASHAEMWRQMEERRRLNAAFSHDLRTPLTVLHGYTDLLAQRLPTGTLPPKKVEETLHAMSTQVVRLERYVQSMQALQKLDDLAISPAPTDGEALAGAMRTAAEIVCGAAGKTLAFACTLPDGPLPVDAAIVQQVFENLLSNAARFARNRVSVAVIAAAGALSVTVSDDGHGFTAESLRRAKDPFYSSGDTDGTHFGLGLNIADILCAKHGGRLSIGNNAGGGARVQALFAAGPPPM